MIQEGMTVTWTGGTKGNEVECEGKVTGISEIGSIIYATVKIGSYYSIVPESLLEVKE